jgi:hypothetical protein
MSSLVEKWEPLGVLDGLAEDEKEVFSQYCENAVNFIMNEFDIDNEIDIFYSKNKFEGLILPIIRRIFKKHKKELNYLDLYYDFLHESGLFYEYNENILREIQLRFVSSIDLEAEEVFYYTENFTSLTMRKIIIESLSFTTKRKKKEIYKRYGVEE